MGGVGSLENRVRVENPAVGLVVQEPGGKANGTHRGIIDSVTTLATGSSQYPVETPRVVVRWETAKSEEQGETSKCQGGFEVPADSPTTVSEMLRCSFNASSTPPTMPRLYSDRCDVALRRRFIEHGAIGLNYSSSTSQETKGNTCRRCRLQSRSRYACTKMS
jgi:hypothetical protein